MSESLALSLYPGVDPDTQNPLIHKPALLIKDAEFRKQLKKASSQLSAEAIQSLTWVPQPVSFESLAAFHHPVHDSCLDVKTNMTVGLGLTEGGDTDADLPGNMTGETFLDVQVQAGKDAETTGNGYIEEVEGGKEYYWLPAHTMEMSVDREHQLYRQVVGGQTRVFRAYHNERDTHLNRVIHVRYPSTWSTYYGGISWMGGIRHLLLSENALRWNQAFFANHCMPMGVLYLTGMELDKKITQGRYKGRTPRDLVKSWLQESFGGADKAHRIMLLSSMLENASVKFERLTEPVKDGDFLKLMEHCDTRIAISHQTPRELISMPVTGKLGNTSGAEQLVIFFLTTIAARQRIWNTTLNRTIGATHGKKLTLRSFDYQSLLPKQPEPMTPEDALEREVKRLEKALGRLAA